MTGYKAGNKGRATRSVFSGNRSTTEVATGLANNELPSLTIAGVSEEVMQWFLPIMVERLEKELGVQSVGFTGKLRDSFKYKVRAAGNKVSGEVKFNFYGRFVDMGVGKGVTLGEKQNNRQISSNRSGLTHKRVAKPWFSKVYALERERLSEIMAGRLQKLVLKFSEDLNQKVEIKLAA
jgi:hypothetical protein